MRIRHLAAFTAASALVLSAPAYVGQAAAEEPVEPAPQASSEQLAAEEALETLEHAMGEATLERNSLESAAFATLAFRDLAFLAKHLPMGSRREAARYLARPTETGSDPYFEYESEPAKLCAASTPVCVHYVDKALHPLDPDSASQSQAATSLSVAESVLEALRQSGYRQPLSDTYDDPADGRLDIYLGDTFSRGGLYGYCIPIANGTSTVAGYCGIDNDFEEFDNASPVDNLRVTLAHELFHAVQFAYDAREDLWLMEGTAAWVEDELYDSINDNLQFIHPSALANPLTKPHVPLDRFDDRYPNYGVWTFWKRLSERYPAKQGQLPKVILDVWRRAGGLTRSGASTMALSKVLEDRGTSFGAFFTKWGVGNRFPRRAYSEGAALHYPAAPVERGFALSKRKRSIGWQSDRLNHMTNAHYRFKPKGLTGKRWRIRVEVDGPARIRGPYATLVVYKRSGAIKQVRIKLDSRGDGAKRVRFGKGSVRRVELTLTNGSNRFKKCYSHYPWHVPLVTCMGDARDDRLRFLFRARVTR